jgi:FtsH-binding integral membrane protein
MSWQSPVQSTRVDQIVVEEGQRTFMAKVYRWMFLGLSVTGGVALYTASTPALLAPVLDHLLLLIIAELAVVLGLSFIAHRLSAAAAGGLFLLYAVLNGLTFSTIFLVYQLGSIGEAFLLTAVTFGAMSAYATFTKRDLSAWRTFLVMGLLGVFIAGLIQLFWHSEGFSFVWSCACVVVFAGLTAYDTQKLRQMYSGSQGVQSQGWGQAATWRAGGPVAAGARGANLSIIGALTLYLDFVNLFLALLRLFGRRR